MTRNPEKAGAPQRTASWVVRWLRPLLVALPDLQLRDWEHLGDLDAALRSATPGLPTADRGPELLRIRRQLAPLVDHHDHGMDPPRGDTDSGVRAAVVQTLRQVVCGYHDLDFRDATGPGHGRMILRHAPPATRHRWAPRLRAGDLAGVAMTEAHGGSQVRAITTTLTPAPDGWQLDGRKTHISRLYEASVWVVLARRTDGALVAAAVDASSPGIFRKPEKPAGLDGWTWGQLTLSAVPVPDDQVLFPLDLDGMGLVNQHFTQYRALVMATALGGALAAADLVAAHLLRRQRRGDITRIRDNALIALGRAHAQINAGLLTALHTQRLAATEHNAATLWGQSGKGLGVDLARGVLDELSALIGAAGFTVDHPLQRTRRALEAFRFADGIHDGLYRSAGQALLVDVADADEPFP